VIHVVRVNVESRDRPLPVVGHGVGALAGACARARSIEGGEVAVGSAQKAMRHVVCVNVVSCDHPEVVDVPGDRALVGACARARSVKRRDGSVGSAQEDLWRIQVKITLASVSARLEAGCIACSSKPCPDSLRISIRVRRPAAAREALGFRPLVQAGWADSPSVECIPLLPAGAEPLVFLAGRPAAERAADARLGWLVALLFLKLAIRDG
jgi:hypothetical protein